MSEGVVLTARGEVTFSAGRWAIHVWEPSAPGTGRGGWRLMPDPERNDELNFRDLQELAVVANSARLWAEERES